MTNNLEEAMKAALTVFSFADFLPSTNRELYKTLLKLNAITYKIDGLALYPVFEEERSERLLKLAENGDYLAKEVIREFIGDCIAQKIPLPPALGNYVLDNLNRASSKVKRGVKPKKTFYRDLRIGMAVWRVMQCGFPRTRNRATRDAHPESLSACAIVADVLAKYFRVHLSEDAILKAANPWRHLE